MADEQSGSTGPVDGLPPVEIPAVEIPVETQGDKSTADLAVGATVVAAQAAAATDVLAVELQETEKVVEEFESWKTQTTQALVTLSESQVQTSETIQTLKTAVETVAETCNQIMAHLILQPKSSADAGGQKEAVNEVPTSTQAETSETKPEKSQSQKRHWM